MEIIVFILCWNYGDFFDERKVFMKNILITGEKQIGKSTLVHEIIDAFHFDYAGYKTYPYEDVGIGHTYFLEDMLSHEKAMISYFDGQGIKGIPETFSDLGVRCLKNALICPYHVVVLDELGRFEKNNLDFIQCVENLLESHHFILAVLKDEPIPYIDKIKQRQDCLLLDLNQMSYEQAKQRIISEFYTYEGRKNEVKKDI